MSKHIGRKQRWTQETPGRYSSSLGKVFYEKQAWYGQLDYRTRPFNFVEIMPRLDEHLKRGKAQGK